MIYLFLRCWKGLWYNMEIRYPKIYKRLTIKRNALVSYLIETLQNTWFNSFRERLARPSVPQGTCSWTVLSACYRSYYKNIFTITMFQCWILLKPVLAGVDGSLHFPLPSIDRLNQTESATIVLFLALFRGSMFCILSRIQHLSMIMVNLKF